VTTGARTNRATERRVPCAGERKVPDLIPIPELDAAPGTIEVAVPKPLHTCFTYRVPAGLPTPAPGCRVRVPFGRQTLVGICLEPAGADARVEAATLRDVIEVLDHVPVLSGDVLELAGWAAGYYHHPIGEVFATALPALIRLGADPADLDERRVRVVEPAPLGARLGPRQAAALELVRAVGGRAGIEQLREAGHGARVVRSLIERGWLEPVTPDPVDDALPPAQFADSGFELLPEQRAACEAIRAGGPGTYLLHGVTGSGKTEVYLKTLETAMRSGAQTLVLIPEIALTPQTFARFEARFGAAHVYHSGLTERVRARVWSDCRAGRARIVIGTRSAVWLPFRRLGLIVVDEEHDGSFKQQEGLRYSARDLAVKRARALGVPLVLGSATPSLETLHNAARRRYRRLALTRRTGAAAMPRLSVVDLRGQPLTGGMSPLLQRAVRRHLDAGSQALLFINRRGFAPVLLCNDCGWVASCPRCDVRLTVHQRPSEVLRCHQCALEVRPVPACPHCGGTTLRPVGLGTQRSEQGVEALFPDVPVLRIDRDNTRSARRLDAQLARIHSGRPMVLVGTQLLAKGHHFPSVTLVGVLNADAGFMSPDFRAPEHTAQLIVQVAGRAGRADREGEVLIQTHNPDNPILKALVRHGYDGFAETELAQRAAAHMPPFRSLALLRGEGRQLAEVLETLDRMVAGLRGTRGLEVLGPVPAPVGKRADRYRCQCLLISERRPTLHQALDALVTEHAARRAGGVRFSIDVDPYDTF